jgi:hypothetical protein
MEAGRSADPTAKVVVFSHYDTMLALLSRAMRVRGVGHALLQAHGQDRVQRQGALERFRHDPTCHALLLRVGLGAQGLTLTSAHTVYLCEPCADAAAEAQAMNRVHRIGQSRPARCVVLYMERSAEERRLRARAGGRVGALATATVSIDADDADAADGDRLAGVLEPASAGAAAPLDAWLVGVPDAT